MADKTLRPHGVPQPKGTGFLNEVRLDAARNTIVNLRRSAEQRQFDEAKARGLTVDEVIGKGREDLLDTDPGFFGEFDGTSAPETPASNAASQTADQNDEAQVKEKAPKSTSK